ATRRKPDPRSKKKAQLWCLSPELVVSVPRTPNSRNSGTPAPPRRGGEKGRGPLLRRASRDTPGETPFRHAYPNALAPDRIFEYPAYRQTGLHPSPGGIARCLLFVAHCGYTTWFTKTALDIEPCVIQRQR
ncbi:hypothetical protein LCGC14_0993120, partial [marine sediment metagenome]